MNPAKHARISLTLAGAALLAMPDARYPAFAQDIRVQTREDLGLRSGVAAETPRREQTPQPEPNAIDWSVLNWDASKLSTASPKTLRSAPAAAASTNWNRTEKPDGSAAVTVNRKLPTTWDSKVGVDMNLAGSSPSSGAPIDPAKLLPGATPEQSNGAAWANVTAPSLGLPIGWDKATIDARYDPLQEQRKLGTNVSKSIPLGERWSVTLQNGYSVTQAPQTTATSPAPASTAPLPGVAAQHHSTYTTDNSAKLNLLPTGTAFSVGSSLSSDDEKWLRKFSAEQKLFDGVSVSGSVSETPTGIPNRSISAGFKRTW
jgi:hypothetical protein